MITNHPLKSRFPNLDQKTHRLGPYWSWDHLTLIFSFIIHCKLVIVYQNCVSHSVVLFCIYLVKPSPVSVPHPTWLRTYTDPYAPGQCILMRPLEFSQPQLGDWHCILQAAYSLNPIICASHVDIWYAIIRQSLKNNRKHRPLAFILFFFFFLPALVLFLTRVNTCVNVGYF